MSLMKYTKTQIFDRRDRQHPTILYEDYSEHSYWHYGHKAIYFYTADVSPILVDVVENAKYVARVRAQVSQRLEVFNVSGAVGIYLS